MKTVREDSLLSQRYIKNALLKLLGEQSLSDISITSLCLVAGVSRVTFYKYYDSLDDVMKIIVHEAMEDYQSIIELKDIKDDHLLSLREFFSFIANYETVLKSFVRFNKTEYLYQCLALEYERLFPLDIDDPVLREVQYAAFTGGLYRIGLNWIISGQREPIDVIAEYAYDVLYSKKGFQA